MVSAIMMYKTYFVLNKSMVLFNGKQIAKYKYEGRGEFLDRVASEFGTLSEYLYFPDGLGDLGDEDDEREVEVIDLLEEFRKSRFSDVMREYEGALLGGELTGKDVVGVFLAVNKRVEKYGREDRDGFYDQVLQDISAYMNIVSTEYEFLWSNRNKRRAEVAREIQSNREEVARRKRMMADFYADERELESTDFEVESYVVRCTLELSEPMDTILRLFDSVTVTSDVQMIRCGEYFKILKDFRPSRVGDYSESESYKDYIILSSETDGVESTGLVGKVDGGGYQFETEVSAGDGDVEVDKIVSKFLGVFGPGGVLVRYSGFEKTMVKGVYNYPLSSFDTYVFSDLVMNNELFSYYMSINESDKATKTRRGGLYVRFVSEMTGGVSFVITEREVKENTPQKLRRMDKHFPLGSTYLRVKISLANYIEDVERFKAFFSRMMILYYSNVDRIEREYREFIPSFSVHRKEQPERTESQNLQDAAPGIFVEYYSRWCREEKQPTIVSDEEAARKESEGLQVMRFPRAEEGVEQKNYVCENKDYPWPGVQKNNTASKNNYPLIPCCFAKNQSNTSKFRGYFSDDKSYKGDEKVLQDIYIGKKFVPFNGTGTVSENIETIMKKKDTESGIRYLRKGTYDTPSSFLDCVLSALNVGGINKMVSDDRKNFVSSIREDLASEENACKCKQQMYESTTKDIMDIIRDDTKYFDPQLFSDMLESVFDCTIILFKDGDDISGEMVLPRYAKAYYSYEMVGPCVCVYEHRGSESDQAVYPRCELIMRWNQYSSTDWSTSYPEDGEVMGEINRYLKESKSKLRTSYCSNKEIPVSVLPWSDEDVEFQAVDTYGKARMMVVDEYYVFTSPLPPLTKREVRFDSYKKVDIRDAMRFMDKHGIRLVGQGMWDRRVNCLNGLYGELEISIPVEDSNKIKGLVVVESDFGNERESMMSKFNRNKKISLYLSEYSLWLFSRYIEDREITDEEIVRFGETKFTIDKKYIHEVPESLRLTDDTRLMRDGKLVLDSVETLKRVLYLIKLTSTFDLSLVRSVKNNNYIRHFYKGVKDFKSKENEIMLKGEKAVLNWINTPLVQKHLQDSIVVYYRDEGGSLRKLSSDEEIVVMTEEDKPRLNLVDGDTYLFKNSLVSQDVLLAKNVSSLGKMAGVFSIWENEGYIKAEDIPLFPVPSFDLYSYVNSSTITLHEISGDIESDKRVKVLGYILGDEPYYTVLLKI